jgi:hypothetical protein
VQESETDRIDDQVDTCHAESDNDEKAQCLGQKDEKGLDWVHRPFIPPPKTNRTDEKMKRPPPYLISSQCWLGTPTERSVRPRHAVMGALNFAVRIINQISGMTTRVPTKIAIG